MNRLFFYDAAGNLVYSKRGEGARRRAVGRVLGIYLTGEMRFGNDAANRLRLQFQSEQDLRCQWVQDIDHDLDPPDRPEDHGYPFPGPGGAC